MPGLSLDLNPTTHITADAVGKPGQRVFYLQGRQENRSVVLLIEKVQLQSMAIGVDQFIEELHTQHPNLSEESEEYDEEKMHILPPVDPLFRAGELGLAYDEELDLVLLIAREAQTEGQDAEESGVVRFWCTRSQLCALSNWGLELASRGRPLCPQCGEPMEPEGHFCPKKNGNRH